MPGLMGINNTTLQGYVIRRPTGKLGDCRWRYLGIFGGHWEWSRSIMGASVWLDREEPTRSAEIAARKTPGVECISFRQARKEGNPFQAAV